MAETLQQKTPQKPIIAVGLLSGGLDSTLAARVLIDQGIDVHAINFTSPFCTCTAKGSACAAVVTAVRQLGNIPLERVAIGDEYLEMVRNPKYGYGRGMNPCIDCRILKLRKAAEYMRSIGASFLFTGEVLGQRPMSQTTKAIHIIDRDSGLKGLLLRPLSAQLFEPTIPEVNGWVDRSKLLAISGRTRKPQIALAKEKGIADYPCPAGGCRLTDENFAERLRDYFAHTEKARVKDMAVLKIGRHFRLDNGDKVVVTRDEAEGEAMLRLAQPEDHLFVPTFAGAPVTLLQGKSVEAAVRKMMEFTKTEMTDLLEIEHHHGGVKQMIQPKALLSA
jgi:tRNA-uridine 2-sulfurtransferase